MWLVLSTILIHLLIEALLVGLAFAAIVRRYRMTVSNSRSFLVVLPVFLILAIYYMPALNVLDARLLIGNESIAREIGPGTPIALAELFRFGPSDAFAWALQAVIATWVARWSLR